MVDRNALARATESTTSPTPGYLYNDIAKSAATSPSSSSEIATYLIRRLQSKNNVNIKYKCLKVIQMVATHPATRGQFKRVVIQDTNAVAAIKLCLQFRGPPDAVHGDMLYEKVRNQAKETLDAIYSDDPSSSQQGSGAMSGGGGSSQGGFGNQSYGGQGGYGNSYNSGYGNSSSSSAAAAVGGPKKMEGIGNPMFADPRLEEKKGIRDMTVTDVISGVKEGFVGMIKDPLARNVPSVGGPTTGGMGNSGYGGPSGGVSSFFTFYVAYLILYTKQGKKLMKLSFPLVILTFSHNQWNSAPPGQSQLAHSTNGQWTMASNRGPNAISSETYRGGGGNVSSGVGGSWGAPSSSSVASQARHTAHNPTPVVNISGSTGGAKSDGTYERNLITELCPPGGMKAEPPPDKMQSFAQAIPNLNPDLICPALLDALEDGQPWIIRAKALCVMEVCINVAEDSVKSGRSGNNAYADFFHACKDEIEPLATHTRSAVRDPAKRVLKALGLDIPEKSSDSVAAGASARMSAPVVPAQAAPAPNLLDFDEPVVPSEAPLDVPPPPPPTEAPPAPPAPAGGSQSLFGGMQMKSGTTPATAQVAPPAAPTPVVPVANDSDLLGSVSQPTMTSPSPGGSLFDDVAIKATPAVNAPVVEKENVEVRLF